MKNERGLFNSKSPDGGGCLAIIVLAFILYTMANLHTLTLSLDNFFVK